MEDVRRKELLVLGCGYLGTRLVEEAVARGYSVKAVSRNVDALERAGRLGAETFCGMVDDSGWHGFAGDSVDLVVNCVSSAGGGLAGYEQSYVGGNRSLWEWAGCIGFLGTAVFTSSVGVYPDVGGVLVHECDEIAPPSQRGRLMLESEQVFLEASRLGRWFVLRLAGLYGPDRHLMLDTVRSEPETLPGWGDYYLNLARIEDVVRSIWSCFESDRAAGGIFNVVDDESVLKSEIVEWMAKRLGVAVPSFSGKAGLGSRRFAEGGRPANRRVSNRRIREELGWRPVYRTFREGFADLV